MIPIETWRSDAQYFDANGHKIAYWTSGDSAEKPWLLLIHGFPTSSWDWSGVWPALGEKFNLAALDMLGFGLSDKPQRHRYSVIDQADLQEAMLGHLGVSEAHILAHDYGNSVAQELLARHNDHDLSFSIKSLCFLNGGLFPEQHRPVLVQKLAISPIGFLLKHVLSKKSLRKNFDQIFGAQTKASDAEIDAHWALIKRDGGLNIFHKLLQYIPERKINRARWVGALTQTTIPLYLINGGADPISGKHLYDYFLEMVPGAGAVLFEEIGHYPQTEAPNRVLAAFTDFHQSLKPA